MASTLPDFITREFLQPIIEKQSEHASGRIELVKFWGEPATKPGDNYASDMYLIHLELKIDEKSCEKTIILKLMPSGELQVVIMRKNMLYEREIHSYNELIAEAEKLVKNAGFSTQFAPRCFYTALEPKPMLVFENVKEKGYEILSRTSRLNFDQASAVLDKLAIFHAASAVIYEKSPSIMDPYIEGSISSNPNRQDFLVHYTNCAKTLGLVAEKEWSAEYKEIAMKLQVLSKSIIQRGVDLYIRDESKFAVLNQNDLWIPNIFFKFNEDRLVSDVLFIDFQMPYFGSPAIDLNFFLFGSLNDETRVKDFFKIVRKYHEKLSEALRLLNYPKKIPTLHEIHVELIRSGFQSLIAAIAEVPLLLMEHNENLRMDLLLAPSREADEFRYSLFNNPKYKTYIQPLLIDFNNLGYLD